MLDNIYICVFLVNTESVTYNFGDLAKTKAYLETSDLHTK